MNRDYRGFVIKKMDDQSWGVFKSEQCYSRCNSAWGCIAWVDEFLSP